MAKQDKPALCRKCGKTLMFVLRESGLGYIPYEWGTATIHKCTAVVKVFTDEEKKEFARKRLAGEV